LGFFSQTGQARWARTGKRGCSSAGRAPDLHSGGRRFDPDQLHQLYEKRTPRVGRRPERNLCEGEVGSGWVSTLPRPTSSFRNLASFRKIPEAGRQKSTSVRLQTFTCAVRQVPNGKWVRFAKTIQSMGCGSFYQASRRFQQGSLTIE
jgi:hypothetical protein